MPGFSSNAKSAEGRLPTETLNYRKKTCRLLADMERFVKKTGRGFLGQIERQQTQKKKALRTVTNPLKRKQAYGQL